MKTPLLHRHALLAAIFFSSMVPRSHGAEFTVTSAADTGAGTLRAALASAATNTEADTIRFAPALAGGTISLTTDSTFANLLTKFGPTGLVVNGDTVTLDGLDAPFLKISGADARRILAVTATGNLTLKNLTFTKGKAQGGKGGDGTGCGHGGGGGAGLGGGVWVEGSLQVIGCTFSNNQALGGNGGAPGGQTGYVGTGGGGGGFGQNGQNGVLGGAGAIPGGGAGQNYGEGGVGVFGGGGGGGGGSREYAPNALGNGAKGGFGGGSGGYATENATFGGSGTTGGGAGISRSGGGGAALGGAIFLRNGTCSLVNSTFYANSATAGMNFNGNVGSGNLGSGNGQGGAIFNYEGQLSVLSCTIAENDATPETPPYTYFAIAGISGATETSNKGSFSIFNTIIVSATEAADVGFFKFNSGSYTSAASGKNAIGGVYGTIYGTGYSHTKLGPLTDNGGPTPTVLPASDSNAIFDLGDATAAAGLTVDQRGQPRFAANKTDIGAVQVTLGPPGVEATAATVSGLTAALSATVTQQGATAVTACGFVWSSSATNSDPLIGGTGVAKVDVSVVGPYSASIFSLAVNTSYTFKAYATNSIGTAYSKALTFTTNQAPVITSHGAANTATVTIPENSTAVTTVNATDADLPAQQISYSIVGGADAARFEINATSGAMAFVQPPDFDVAEDANADGVYEVTVQAADNGNTPRTDSQQISVSITDVPEIPLLALTTGTSLTPTRGTLGGTVVHDGGGGEAAMILERGVVYAPTSLNGTPTLSGAGCEYRVTAGTTGLFTLAVDELSPGTVYAYRAYATNASGTAYGPVATFTTGAGPALNGDFWTQVAGSTTGVSGTSNGTGAAAKFNGPKAITADSNGDLYVADTLSHTARKIVGSSFAVSTQLGVAGTAGSNNQALFTTEKFNSPSGITYFNPSSGAGQYFIADTVNHTIRQANFTVLFGWTITTHVGTAGSSGSADGTGAAARFLSPQGVTADASGNVYVADTGNHTIRKIDASQAVTTVVPKLISSAAYWGISIPGVASSWNGSYTQLALSYGHVLGLKSNGTVAAWGINGVGETTVPAGLTGVTAVAAGHQHSLALKNNGTVVAWGLDDDGQSTVPAGLAGVTAISARDYVSLALKNDGTVVAWGGNSNGQATVPADLSGVTAISAGGYHCLALKSNGTVVGWGNNTAGESSSATQQAITNAVAIATGGSHSMALLADGTVRCWGSNAARQCDVPAGLSGVKAIGAGNYFSYALKQDGSLVSWGSNGAGVRTLPASVTGRSVSSLAVGPSNIAVLMNEELNAPAGLAVDAVGRVLIADTGNHVVRRYDPATGEIILIAGRPGVAGSTEGVGTAALLNSPRGITVDTAGNLYVTQTGDHTIRWITPDGRVRNVGGLPGTSGLANGAPENVRFNTPGGIAALDTTIYVADTGNNRIVKGSPLYRPMTGAGAASNLTTTSATLNGWVNPNGKAATARFEYGLTTAFGTTATVSLASASAATGQIAQANLSGLTASTTYHFRLVATNADGSTTSQTGTFTTGGPATLASASSSNVAGATATLSGEILDNGGLTVTARGFVYAKTAANALPVLSGNGVTALTSAGDTSTFSSTASGLEAGTGYSFRAYATSSAGTSYSEVNTFTTGGPATLAGASSSNVTATTATLSGEILDNGGLTVTARGFVFAKTAANAVPVLSGSGVTALTSAGDTSTFNSTASGLGAGTGYSFRAYATNSAGTSYSEVATFTTDGPATLASASSSNVTTTTAALSGEILDNGRLAVTSRGFVYAKTAVNPLPLPGRNGVTTLTSDGDTSTFSSIASGLETGTGYSFRAYATNSAGTSYSEAATFTTVTLGRVILDNTAGKTRALSYHGNGISPTLAFGYRITTGNEGFDLNSIALAFADIDRATALRIRLFAAGADSLPAGPALATQDYASRSFGYTPSYSTFPLSGFRLNANTSYILLVGSSSGRASWNRYEPNIDPQSSAGLTANSIGTESNGIYNASANASERWSIQLTGTPFIASPPSVTLPVASEIGATSAKLAASVSTNGGAGVTDFGFVYAPATLAVLPVIDAANVVRAAGIGSPADFAADVSGLFASLEYTVRAYATNSAGTSYSEAANFTTLAAPTLSPSEIWRQQYYGITANSGNAADLAIPDGDGIANLLKYGLCITPGSNGSSGLPVLSQTQDKHLSLRFRRDPLRNDVNLIVEAQSNLSDAWTSIARSDAGGAFIGTAESSETTNLDGTRTVEVKDSQPISAAPKRFLRVRVTNAPLQTP